jgi:hypothetical protein
MSEWKMVSKDEFYEYAKKYSEKNNVKLERDVAMMCEPPLMTLNDFSNGEVWPKSIVAKAYVMDGSDYYSGKTTEYFIPK